MCLMISATFLSKITLLYSSSPAAQLAPYLAFHSSKAEDEVFWLEMKAAPAIRATNAISATLLFILGRIYNYNALLGFAFKKLR